MKRLALALLNMYQKYASPLFPPACVFYPTCSEYMRQAIQKYGVPKGVLLGVKRILRCHPWQKDRMDPLR